MNPAQIAYERLAAIDVLLRLMGCTDAKQANCEHVAAVSALANAITKSTFQLLDEACGGALTEAGLVPSVATHFRPGATGKG